jgi:Zinc finger C-x8-C-x5-C-x3-H type (and similar)
MSPNHRIQAEQLSKTRRCSFFLEGRCKYTEGCTYAHSLDEIRKAPEELRKTKMCDLFLQGLCRDDKCNFAHDYQEIRCRRRSRPVNDAGRHHSISSLASSNTNDETVILLRQIAALLQAKTAPQTTPTNIPPGFEAPSILGYQTACLAHRDNANDSLSDTLNRLAFLALSCTEEESANNEQVVTPLPTNPGFSLY